MLRHPADVIGGAHQNGMDPHEWIDDYGLQKLETLDPLCSFEALLHCSQYTIYSCRKE